MDPSTRAGHPGAQPRAELLTVAAAYRGIVVALVAIVTGALLMAACSSGGAGGTEPSHGGREDVLIHGKIHYDDEHKFGTTYPCGHYAWTVDIKDGSGIVLRAVKASTPSRSGTTPTGGKYCDASYTAAVPSTRVYSISVEHGQGQFGGDWDTIFTALTVNAGDLRDGPLPDLIGTGY